MLNDKDKTKVSQEEIMEMMRIIPKSFAKWDSRQAVRYKNDVKALAKAAQATKKNQKELRKCVDNVKKYHYQGS